MRSEQLPLTDSPFANLAWPSDGSVVLVLDGAAVPDVARTIYEWSEGEVDAECLYASTRWEPVSEFAPWLVWLKGKNDPAVHRFVEQGAVKEWGYFLVSDQKPAAVRQYLRTLIEVERVAGCPELLRIAHPELARRVIGERLIIPSEKTPSAVIRQIISPDLVSEEWVAQELLWKPEPSSGRSSYPNVEALDAAFTAFNRRRDNLVIWEGLEKDIREWLGGLSLSDAYPQLAERMQEAEPLGCLNLREKMRYLLEQYRHGNTANPALATPHIDHG